MLLSALLTAFFVKRRLDSFTVLQPQMQALTRQMRQADKRL